MSRGKRVVVIGAGLSGLAAAWKLRAGGCDVTVLERARFAGGRAAGARIDGFVFERSLHLLRSNDAHLESWMREVGVADDLLPLRPVIPAQLYRGKATPLQTRSLRDIARIPGVRPLEALLLVRFPRLMRRYASRLDRHAPERAADWDYRSVADFARLYFGTSVYERWIAPIATAATLGDPAQLSRVVFLLEWLAEEHGRLGVARRGISELPAVAAEKLGASFGELAVRLAARAEGGYVVQCKSGSTLEADAVVLATSGAQADRIAASELTLAERDFFAELRTGPEAVLTAALNRPATGSPQYVRVPFVDREPVDSVLVEPGVADGRAPLGLGIATVAASQAFCEASLGASDDVVQKELIAAFERTFPSVVGTIRFTRLFRSRSGLPRFEVGAYRALDRFRRVQLDRRAQGRRLYFAGAYLSGLAADQRVGSGRRAATDLLADLSD